MEKSTFTHEYEVLIRLLREVRQAAQVTQIELAERLGESQSYISKCERGERRLDVVQLRAFCQAMETTLGEFIARFEKRLGQRKKT